MPTHGCRIPGSPARPTAGITLNESTASGAEARRIWNHRKLIDRMAVRDERGRPLRRGKGGQEKRRHRKSICCSSPIHFQRSHVVSLKNFDEPIQRRAPHTHDQSRGFSNRVNSKLRCFTSGEIRFASGLPPSHRHPGMSSTPAGFAARGGAEREPGRARAGASRGCPRTPATIGGRWQ